MKRIQDREPLTEQEVIEFLDQEVNDTVRRWGEDDPRTKLARDNRDRQLEAFRNGEVVPVMHDEYVADYGHGCECYMDTLYSDGHVGVTYYGYLD